MKRQEKHERQIALTPEMTLLNHLHINQLLS